MALWSFVRTAHMDVRFGTYYSLATLAKDGIHESFFIRHATLPTLEQAEIAGHELALRKNLEEAPLIETDVLSREDFLARFTNAEIAAIYRAAGVDDDVFAYVKKMELNPTIRRSNPDTQAGLAQLEAAGLLAPGRAAEILG